MVKWFVKYTVCSALCLGVVWFAVPLVRTRYDAEFAGKSATEVFAILKSRVLNSNSRTNSGADDVTPTDTMATSQPTTAHVAEPINGAVDIANTDRTANQPVVTNYTTKVEYEYEQLDGTMGTKPPEYEGSGYPWGVLETSSDVYTSSGDVLAKLPGGTVVEKMSEHTSSKGQMFRCRILHDGTWREGYFIEASALIMFDSSYDATKHADRDLIVKYFTLKGKITDHRAELKEIAVKSNPHFTEYQKAAKALTEFQEKSKKLIAQRDSSSGMARHKVDDELRTMKSKEATLINDFRRAEIPYKKWRQEHVAEVAADDDSIRKWKSEMDRIESDVEDVAGIDL